MTVFLHSLATAVPPHELPQDIVLDNARRILGSRYSGFERLAGTFTTSGVEKRYSFAPLDWFQTEKNWPERNRLYLEGGKALFIDAASQALNLAGLQAADVDCIVTVSSTGIATPTLEALSAQELGFRADAKRVPVFGLGCAGGVSGLAIAQSLAAAEPGSKVLLVAIEACTLSFRSDRLEKSDIIATVLFGDGAAAAILSTSKNDRQSRQVEVGIGQQEMWENTLDIMGWDVDETGLGVIFDRSIPDFTREYFADAVDRALSRMPISRGSIDRFVCHPGGAKVVEAIEQALGLEDQSLTVERETLRQYGNMSAPTALFVLKGVLEGECSGQFLLTALGPGFTASFLPVFKETTDA